MLEIRKNMENNLPMDLMGCMHKYAKETHSISDVKIYNGQVNKFPHKLVLGMNIYK